MAAAPNTGGGEGRGDAEVEETAGQLGGLHLGDQPQPALQRPQSQAINIEDRPLVYFHVCTTGFGPRRHIMQIAARSGENEMFTFVLPEEPFQITGIKYIGEEMYYHGNLVPYLTIRRALERFINFVGDQGVILIGHNIKCFGCHVLLKALQNCNLLQQFQPLVYRCVDTLPLFRDICNLKIKTEVKDEDQDEDQDEDSGCKNYQLKTLYKHYTKKELKKPHPALVDVQALQEIVNKANPDHEAFRRHSFTFTNMAAAPNTGGGEGRSDAGVEETAGQLEGLNVEDQPQPASQRPQSQPIKTENRRFVFFHVCSTGFGPRRHIMQIAARSEENEMFTFVLPKEPFQITGITYIGEKMDYHGSLVPYLKIRPALEEFIKFLGDEQVVLIGHNIKHFDCPVLWNALQNCNLLERFQPLVYCCVDTLPLFRDICKDQVKDQVKDEDQDKDQVKDQVKDEDQDKDQDKDQVKDQDKDQVKDEDQDKDQDKDQVKDQDKDQVKDSSCKNYQLKTLYQHYTKKKLKKSHPALVDVLALQEIMNTAKPDYEAFRRHFFTFDDIINNAKARLLPAWMSLVKRGVISRSLANKASGSGLSWKEVDWIFKMEGEDGVRKMLAKRLPDQPKEIINSICQHLEESTQHTTQ